MRRSLFCLLALVLLLGGCKRSPGAGGAAGDSTSVQAAAKDEEKGNKEGAGKEEADKEHAAKGESEKASGESEGKEGEEGDGKRTVREQVATVNAARVTRGDLVVPVLAEGALRARRSTLVRVEVRGCIVRLLAEEGQAVRKGQVLVEIDGREYRIAMEEARARYLKALGVIAVEEDSVLGSTDPGVLDSKVAGLDELEKAGKISREERRARELELGVQALRHGGYRRELVEARSGLSLARADEERARLNLERTVIRAPFDGVVSELRLAVGQLLSLGDPVCTLVDNVALEAELGVLESDVGGLQLGRPALLVVPALDETLRVKVDVINPSIEPQSRTCRVLLRVRNTDGRLQPGMFVRAAIAGKIYPDKLMVPNEAILTRDGRPLVFKIEGDQAKWVYVQLGLRNDRFAEVESVLQGGPLDEGTLVVVSDHLTLSHDAKVKVRRVVDMTVAWSASAEE
ncbi:MAG TPA: efflux RND transporter periplasmic adaptor subunit [Candidatus Krumholzibacteria bacterium]|nr:efflux RND transporter periplasmic adaptor subunit [Candidatus Krumholzibacteria bacterium]